MSEMKTSGLELNRELSVDLQNKVQAEQKVRSCHVKLPRKSFLFGGAIRSPKPVKYRLEVSYSLDDRLVVAPGESVLLLRHRESQGDKIIVEVGKDGNVLDYELYFDPTKIIDCIDKENSATEEFSISYIIKAVREDNNEVVRNSTIEGSTTIKLQRLQFSAPKIEFKPNKVGMNLEYNILSTTPIEIGQLRVRNASDLLRSPACSIRMNVVARRVVGTKQHDEDGLIWFGKDIKQTHPRTVATENALTPNSVDASNFKHSLLSRDEVELYHIDVNKEQIDSAYNDNEVVIPIFWDMQKVTNPMHNEEKYCIFIKATAMNDLDHSSIEASYADLYVSLLRNNKDMNIEVTFLGDELIYVDNGKPLPLVKPYTIYKMTTTYEFRLRNSAEAVVVGKEHACIFVKEFSLPLNINHIVRQQRGEKDAVITFVDEYDNPTNLDKEFTLGIGGHKSIRLVYDHSCIESLMLEGKPVFELDHKLTLSFKYYIDKDNEYSNLSEIDDSKFTSFKTTLPICMRKAPKPEWMCIDLGTSAIVASYGTFHDAKGQIAENLIELGLQKQKLMDTIHKSDKNKVSDTSETDLRFINSTMAVNLTHLFRNENVLAPLNDDYKKLSIWLSPTTGMVDFYARMLPSLKSIVGHKIFPKELLPYGVLIADEDPITIEAIFKSTYEQLFKFFIPKGPSEETENVVMTVPNTYSPANIAMLRNIVNRAMPQLRNVRFISESDAVVFYYLSRRDRILRNTKIANKRDIDKSILVYDMGAGTLDITYVTRTDNNGNIDISFKGKLGVSRAGNYLDYLIADIIADIVKRPETSDDLKNIIALNGDSLTPSHRKSAGLLKAFVRNVVKPLLNNDDNTPIIDHNNLQTKDLMEDPAFKENTMLKDITVGTIKNHPKMKDYLKEISSDIFTHFNALFSKGGESVAPSLLIFSGRSTSLLMIREAVKDALAVFGCKDNCKFLDLTHGEISEDIHAIGQSTEIGSLKTVIVDGAMAFCSLYGDGNGDMHIHNRNVYAQYGVMFRMNSGDWEWVPMIDATTQAINENSAKYSTDGTTIYEYDTRIHRASQMESIGTMTVRPLEMNFNNVVSLYILQSYSSDTLRDWEDGHRDLITIMGAADNFGNIGNQQYYMTIDRQNRISFFIGNAQRQMYPREDIISDSFKKSMWPVVECSKK